VIALLGAFLTLTSAAQKRKSAILQYDQAAYEGMVVLTDGTVVEGAIIFNDNDGIVTVHRGDDSKSFNARHLVRFEYDDTRLERVRRFYALEFTDPGTGLSEPEIFEVLKELPEFAVLCMIDRIKTEARRGLLQPGKSPVLADRSNKKFTQSETVYFVSSEGNFQPYARFLQKEFAGDLLDYNENNTRILDADVFRMYTGHHYMDLVEFAKENKLSFRRKSGIVSILDEYERLLKR
jgi:hypothetical protein